MAIINKGSFTEDNAHTRRERGPLIRVEIAPGRFVKKYRADAEAEGLIQKAMPPTENKMAAPAENKSSEANVQPQSAPEVDDFSTILGVGRATARTLTAHGITTFAQLRQVGKLDYLSVAAMGAIERWRAPGPQIQEAGSQEAEGNQEVVAS